MTPKLFWLITAILLFPVHRAEAQHTKIPRIGYLASAGSSPPEPFRQALRDLGYGEGRNIAFEFRASGGKPERNADLALELVSLKVELIVAEGAGAIRAAKKATSEISYPDVGGERSYYVRVRCQSGSSGREYHRLIQSLARAKRQTFGATEGNHPENLTRGGSRIPRSSHAHEH